MAIGAPPALTMIAQWMGFEHLRGTARKHCRKCKCRSHSLLSKDNALVNTVVFNCRRFNQYPRSQAKSLWSHSVLVFSECHCLLFSEILYIFLESDNFPEIWYFLKIWCFLSFCKYSKIGEFFPKNLRVLQNLEFYKIWNSPKKNPENLQVRLYVLGTLTTSLRSRLQRVLEGTQLLAF